MFLINSRIAASSRHPFSKGFQRLNGNLENFKTEIHEDFNTFTENTNNLEHKINDQIWEIENKFIYLQLFIC